MRPARCPFCEGHERETPPEVDVDAAEGREHDTPGWKVRVVPNKYPAIPGHEVVIHGPEHLTALADASDAAGRGGRPHVEPPPRGASLRR